MRKQARRTASGFTLIELMIVVAIIGVLASIAIPEYQNMTYRGRIAEREAIMRSIAKAVEDFTLNAQVVPASFTGQANPRTEDQLDSSRAPWVQDHGASDNWRDLPLVVDGGTFCAYSFAVDPATAPVRLYVRSACDIDGDGTHNVKVQVYEGYGNAYVLNTALSTESGSNVF